MRCKPFLLALASLALLGADGSRPPTAFEFMESAKVSLSSAISAASREHPQAIPIRAEISLSRPGHAYSVYFLTDESVIRCDVDSFCAEVLGTEERADKNLDELRRIARQSRVPLVDAVTFAERRVKAKAFHAALQTQEDRTRAIVWLFKQDTVVEFPLERLPKPGPRELVKAH